MNKKKNSELSQMFKFAGNRHWLTIAGCVLAGISTVLSMIPFVCIWFVVRDIVNAMIQGDQSLAIASGHYAWLAVAFSLVSIFLYFLALCCSHLAACRIDRRLFSSSIARFDRSSGYADCCYHFAVCL